MEDLRRRARELEAHKGFGITLEQGLAYPTGGVGEAAEGVLRLSRNGHADVVGATDAGRVAATRERLGEEICDVGWNLLELGDLAGVNLEGAFEKKAGRNEGREW